MNLLDFYSYTLIEKLTVFWQLQEFRQRTEYIYYIISYIYILFFKHLDDAMDNRHAMSCEKKGGERDEGGWGETEKEGGGKSSMSHH